ncbi:ABC transporter ATP-binding protein/permease [Patescibacteria group bacterium]|nr:ABC transporter ATP-binding protein/permease [Patescibacteria group bacterium]
MTKIIKRFYRFIFAYKWRFAIFLLTVVIAAVVENLSPYVLKLLIEAVEQKHYEILAKIVLIYAGVRLASSLTDALSFFLGDKVQIPAARDARVEVFKYVQDLDFAYHVNKNTGSLISAFKRGDGAFFNLFMNFHQEVLKTLISLAVVLIVFAGISPEVLWLMAGLFVANVSLMYFLIRQNLNTRKDFNEAEDTISGIITDNLLNYETVKFFAQEKAEENRLKTSFGNWTKKIWSFSNSFRLMDISIGTVSSVGIWLILKKVVSMLTTGEIGVGDFVMVTGFVSGFYYRFFGLFFQVRNIAKSFIDLEKYFGILENKIMVEDPKVSQKIEKVRGEIRFEGASFKYPGNKRNVLDEINLTIKPGESVAFVGRSGAGKTTVVKLLLRFYDLKKGKIYFDGIDIRKMDKSYLRSFMGVVPQEPILFNNSIAFNISYGRGEIKMDEIRQAAKMANLAEFIEDLPEKYETQVGERGIKLSGGQKQRLAIARAMLINPKLLIFDEATSNLDSESEKMVQEALWKTAKNRTLIIIAHRFSTIRQADKIVVLEKGRIVEVGNHAKLMKKKDGIYRKLWSLQVRGKLDKDEGGLLDGKQKN